MALIVLLLINLSIIHINYIEAARNTDTNVDNTPIAWIRKWCAICETIIIRLKEAVDAFSKTIINRDMEKSTTPRRNQASVPIGKPQLTAENIPSRTTRRDQASAPIDKRQLTAENKASQTNNRQISDPNDGVFMKVGDETFIINEKVPNPPNLAKVFMADLESVVFHIISNDFARYNPLPWQGSGFLFFLARYFPQKNERVSSLLSELDDFVSGIINNNGTVDRIQLRRKVLELLKTYPMKANKWISCRGSENRLNCGLWLLFHTMSMAWTIKYNPGSTVPANRCIQFIQRFVEWYHPDMVGNEADTFLNLVQEDLSYLNSTMVLWDFHNTVRKSRGKSVFPSTYYCSGCDPNSFRYFIDIYFFLVQMYTKIYSREAEIDEKWR